MLMAYNVNEFMKHYASVEDEFMDNMTEAFNVEKTSKYDDVRGYDVKLSFYVDVKAAKKTNRYDTSSDSSINWLEIRKENGNPGWVYGVKKLIAFECGNEWILATPKKLQQFIIEYGIVERTTSRDDFYKYYTRYGKVNELIMKVRTNDLRNYAFKILPKRADNKLIIDEIFD